MIDQNLYKLIKKLGEGAYGAVYKAYSYQLNKQVAIKIIIAQDQDEGIPYTTLREFSVLTKLSKSSHPNLINLYKISLIGYCQIREIHLCCQLMDSDLGKFIKKNTKLSIREKKMIFIQIVKGLKILEQNRIFHRDIKPQNILINQQSHLIKIGDFGLSRIQTPEYSILTKQIQTLWYRAPQLILGSKLYDYKIDIWSLGCVFYQLFQGNILFKGDSEIGQIFKIFNLLGTPKQQDFQQLKRMKNFKSKFPKMRAKFQNQDFQFLDEEGKKLLKSMIHIIPERRINLEQLLKHKYLNDDDMK